jgi:citrate lyase subunit beta/citryl-CoA lyase
MSADLLDLTTMLFVPAARARLLEKARGLPASAVILDLEDGVGAAEKDQAREALTGALETPWPPRPALFVRVNGPRSPHFYADMAVCVPLGPVGVCVPKCETAGDVRMAAAELERNGAGPDMRLLPFVESAKGVVNAHDIASADERVVAIALGSEDLAADMGLRRSKAGTEIAFHRAAVATAARAAGVLAIDAVWIDLQDLAGLEADAGVGRAFGFAGKQIVHPSQIEPVTRAFAPTEVERAWAARIVEAFDAAERHGSGVVVVEGEMVDRPVVLRARRILDASA